MIYRNIILLFFDNSNIYIVSFKISANSTQNTTETIMRSKWRQISLLFSANSSQKKQCFYIFTTPRLSYRLLNIFKFILKGVTFAGTICNIEKFVFKE